ncbi:MAG TPA: SRPBCC family protein [Acidimicrobiales bacterium]|nr:SRPBCC family protein [Acidimicrobiales bacterium]
MSEQAKESIVIKAPRERVHEVVLDFEQYPRWAADLKAVEVLERDDEGRGTKVAFRAAAFGRSTSYTLAYSYAELPEALSWVQVDGDVTRRLDGTYRFAPVDDGTEVTYELEVELKIPLPGFIKSRAESRIVGSALRELKARTES